MGLDMYLTKGKGEQSEEVGYWRKANAIHNFFVNAVQNGVDDQEAYLVPRDVFEMLLEKCDKLLELAKAEGYDPEGDNTVDFQASDHLAKVCQDTLPTQGGFFFGSTDYDGWYFNDLTYTSKLIRRLFDKWPEDEPSEYYYSCWW